MEGNLGEAVRLLRKGAEAGEYKSVNHLLFLEEDGDIFLDDDESAYYEHLRDKLRPRPFNQPNGDSDQSKKGCGCFLIIIIIAFVVYMIAK